MRLDVGPVRTAVARKHGLAETLPIDCSAIVPYSEVKNWQRGLR